MVQSMRVYYRQNALADERACGAWKIKTSKLQHGNMERSGSMGIWKGVGT
jgi:hypothetical protein